LVLLQIGIRKETRSCRYYGWFRNSCSVWQQNPTP